jgi:flagellar basal body-associated protein FliL
MGFKLSNIVIVILIFILISSVLIQINSNSNINSKEFNEKILTSASASNNQNSRFEFQEPLAEENFTIVLLPDSQIYSQSFPHVYTNQTEWIVNYSAEYNIKYVLHEGDITNRNTLVQWENANASQHVMDGFVPYTVSPGNHDLGPNGNAANRDTYMNDYFNITDYQAWPTMGGAFESGKIENTYHLFSACGVDWLIMSLEFAPRDAVLEWANQVVTNHSDRMVMMVTHNYLAGNMRNPGYGGNYGLTNSADGAATGEDIWQDFVKKHRNIICVFSGHILVEAGYLLSNGDNGNPVHQMMANFQMLPSGGNGYLRLVKFDFATSKINVRTYSPYLDQYKTSSQHQFDLDFKKWKYLNDPPIVKNYITDFGLTEDSKPAYINLDGHANPENGIFSDPNIDDGDSLKYFIWTGHNWKGFGSAGKFDNINLTASLEWNSTLKISTKNNKYGFDNIRLMAKDSLDDLVTTRINITITPENDPPIINDTMKWSLQSTGLQKSGNRITCYEDMWANFTVTAYDPLEPEDDSKFRFSSNSSDDYAPFFQINKDTGYVSFLPDNSDVGIYYLKVMVNDTGPVNSYNEYNFMLKINNTNDPPKIITNDKVECNEDELFYNEYFAEDIDPTNDTFIWELFTNALFLSINPSTGNLSGIPENDDVGSYFVNITVSDKQGGFDVRNFTLTVHNTNDPPMINITYLDFYFKEDEIDSHINLNDWFLDIDGDDLIFRGEGDENLTIIIMDNGWVRLIPKQNWNGKGTLKFYANDSHSEISDIVGYNVKPVNDAPSNPTKGNATDADLVYGDTIYFHWTSNVTDEVGWGRTINLSLPAGVHNITLTVKDKAGEFTNTSIELRVLKIPKSPDGKGNDIDGKTSSEQSGNLIIIIIAVILIIITLIIILFWIKKRKKGTDTEAEKTIPETMDKSLVPQTGFVQPPEPGTLDRIQPPELLSPPEPETTSPKKQISNGYQEVPQNLEDIPTTSEPDAGPAIIQTEPQKSLEPSTSSEPTVVPVPSPVPAPVIAQTPAPKTDLDPKPHELDDVEENKN